MKYVLRALLGLAMAAVMLFFISRAVTWDDIRRGLFSLSWGSLGLMVTGVFAIGIAKASRFYAILDYAGIRTTWARTVRIFLASQAFTPLPGGEIGRALLFKRHLGIRLSRVAAPVFLHAVMELWAAALWASVIALSFGGPFGRWSGGLLALLSACTLPLLISKRAPSVLNAVARRGIRGPWMDRVRSMARAYARLLSSRGKRPWTFWTFVIGLSLLSHALGGMIVWYAVTLQGASITVFQAVFAASAAMLIQGVFAFIPGGLGVTEGGLVGILSLFGLSLSHAVVSTLIYRTATLPVAFAIACGFLLPMYGVKAWKQLRLAHPSI